MIQSPQYPDSPLMALRDVAVGYGAHTIVENINFTLQKGEITLLLGENGGGKSTLLKTLLQLIPPLSGRIELLERALQHWRRQTLAKTVGYVPQNHQGIFPFTAEEIVLMGRTPYLAWNRTPKQQDLDKVHAQFERLGITALLYRDYRQLSGGERQLVLIARALVQEPQILIMDEPTASLDFGNELRLLKAIEALSKSGMALCITTHNPQQAYELADQVLLLNQGRLLAAGRPEEVMTPHNLAKIYQVTPAALQARLPFLQQKEFSTHV